MSADQAVIVSARSREVRRFLRTHREGRPRPSLYQVYSTVVVAAIVGVLSEHVVTGAVGRGLSPARVDQLVPAVLLLVVLAALRFGMWQGPVSFTVPDVGMVLTAPVALGVLTRPKLDQSLALGAVTGVVAGGVVLLLVAGGPAGLGLWRSLATVVAWGCLALACVCGAWVTERSRRACALVRRASPALALTAVALAAIAATGSLAGSVAIWSGPWGWAAAALSGVAGWPFAVAGTAVLALAAVLWARRHADSVALEEFMTRAETRAGLTAAAYVLDYRGAALTHRGAVGAGASTSRGRLAPRPRRIRRPRRARWAVLWRDELSLAREPFRLVWSALLGGGGIVLVLANPGNVPAAVAAAVGLYFAAGRLAEPLRVDVDQPDRSELVLARPFGEMLLEHCVLPVVALSAIGAVAIAAAVLAGIAGAGALLLIPTVLAPICAVAVLCGALSARRGGRIDPTLLTTLMSADPMTPGGSITFVLALAPWLILDVVATGGAMLILGTAVRRHHPLLGAGAAALAIAAAAVAALVGTVRGSRRPE